MEILFFIKINHVVYARIIIFGRSLGGAVAVDLATRYKINVLAWHKDMESTDVSKYRFHKRSQNKEKIAAVLLENTFTSIPDIARLLFPFRFFIIFVNDNV